MAVKHYSKKSRKKRKLENINQQVNRTQKSNSNIQKAEPWVPVKMKMFDIPNFFPPEMTFEKRIEAVREIGLKANEEFDKKFPKIGKQWGN